MTEVQNHANHANHDSRRNDEAASAGEINRVGAFSVKALHQAERQSRAERQCFLCRKSIPPRQASSLLQTRALLHGDCWSKIRDVVTYEQRPRSRRLRPRMDALRVAKALQLHQGGELAEDQLWFELPETLRNSNREHTGK